jgi:hypothetical protein
MMKLIGLLALAQLLLIALLYLKLSAIEERAGIVAKPPVTAEADLRNSVRGRAGEPHGGMRVVDGAELRRIIREELRAARQKWAAADGPEPAPADEPIYDDLEMQSRQDRIRSDLNYLRGQDEVSPALRPGTWSAHAPLKTPPSLSVAASG